MTNAELRQEIFGTPEVNYLNCTKGWKSWAFTLDHKRIAVMYLIGVTIALMLGGVFALILRTHLLRFDSTMLTHKMYNQMFTLHGAVMVFAFIIPAIPAAIGNFVLPMMLGAKDVAFPRMNLASFYLWVIGTIVMLLAILSGKGLDTGWTFYTPYSIQSDTGVVYATFGVFILGFSSIFTGLNFIVTTNTMRMKEQSWLKLPLFIWSIYATAIIQVLATPILGITLLLLIAEKTMHIGIFDPRYGGDPVLFQHFFWFYSHPAVYIMVLPAMGIVSELIGVYSQKRVFGYTFVAFSSVAIALVGFLVWGHHLFTSGQSGLVALVFSALSFAVALPSGVKVFNWLATLYKGSILLNTPMIYVLSFIFLFAIGGLTGLFCATLAIDIHLHDTYFIVAHFHFVMVGATLTAFLGGLFHWWPKMFGRMYNDLLGRIGAAMVLAGFCLTFFPQFVMGVRGMPRRYANYDPEFQIFHQLSTLGAFVLGSGIVLSAGVLIYAAFRGPRCGSNPYRAASMEWQTSSPPNAHNFVHDPIFNGPYEYESQVYDAELDSYIPREFADPAKVPPIKEPQHQ